MLRWYGYPQPLSERSRVRRMAVRVMNELSSPAREEDLLVEALRRYADDAVISSLRLATPRVLPQLKQMLADIGPGSAEARDLERTIAELEAGHRPV